MTDQLTSHRLRWPATASAALLAALPAAVATAQTTFVETAVPAGLDVSFTPSPSFIPGLAVLAGGGAAGDFDRDGRTDLFILGGGGTPDRLYLNQGGTFIDAAADWGVASSHMGGGVAVGDYDGDGWLDVYVTSYGPAGSSIAPGQHRLYRNIGGTGFKDVAAAMGVAANDSVPSAFGAAFGDYDLDGDLDLFVAGWFTHGTGGNRLFRNDGTTFTDVTDAAGIVSAGVHGFTPRFVDTDGDRWPEILLAADFETSRYWRNNRDGTFTDLTATSGTGLDCNGMGATIGDFDADGQPDWYVTNIYSSGGATPCGNMLYRNLGDHQFVEESEAAGTVDGWWGWGAVAADLDHDGREDIIAVNGYRDDDFTQVWAQRPSRFFRNLGPGAGPAAVEFADEAAASGFVHTGQGRGVLRLDFDDDGDQDIVTISAFVANDDPWPLTLHRNDAPADRHWLRLRLDTAGNARLAPDGFGARMSFTGATSGPQTRWMDGGSHYLSQSELTAHVGLGPDATADVRVDWPSGQVTQLTAVAADQTLVITAPAAEDVDSDGSVGFSDLLAVIAAWGPCSACPGDVDGSGAVAFGDLVAVLAAWS